MKNIAVYPGTFCPPTFGHVAIARRAAEIFGRVTVVCSHNPDKNGRWFSPEECQEMWRAYRLPRGVLVKTYEEFVSDPDRPSARALIMVRGLRNQSDFAEEKRIAFANFEKAGIDKFFYLKCAAGFENVSSSAARAAAQRLDLQRLDRFVAPLIATRLLEKTLGLKNLFLVVGKPAAGKSTFLKLLAKENPANVHLATDDFNKALKLFLAQARPGADLIDLARRHGKELNRLIGKQWVAMLKNALQKTPPGSNLFVEVAYGLCPDKNLFRLLGGKVLYLGGAGSKKGRLKKRGTPELAVFSALIPGKAATLRLAKKYGLAVRCLETNGTLDDCASLARRFNQELERR